MPKKNRTQTIRVKAREKAEILQKRTERRTRMRQKNSERLRRKLSEKLDEAVLRLKCDFLEKVCADQSLARSDLVELIDETIGDGTRDVSDLENELIKHPCLRAFLQKDEARREKNGEEARRRRNEESERERERTYMANGGHAFSCTCRDCDQNR